MLNGNPMRKMLLPWQCRNAMRTAASSCHITTGRSADNLTLDFVHSPVAQPSVPLMPPECTFVIFANTAGTHVTAVLKIRMRIMLQYLKLRVMGKAMTKLVGIVVVDEQPTSPTRTRRMRRTNYRCVAIVCRSWLAVCHLHMQVLQLPP